MIPALWNDSPAEPPPPALVEAADGDSLLAALLLRRGIHDAASARRFLNPDLYTPASPYDLPDMEQAVTRLMRAIADRETVLVWGDFDVDGQTSTALLVETLTALGADVRYYIPHRQTEGHGVFVPRLLALIDAGAQLVLTCDTGIAAHDAVQAAASRAVDVIITDHHQLPDQLPEAAAAVNPQRLPEGHPLRTLPGVGAAYKLAEALFAQADRAGEEQRLLDLVALGIVADVAVLVDDARYLLQRGLQALRRTNRTGLEAVIEVAGLRKSQLDEGDIGFGLAPRFNALGRLDDANKAVTLLTTDDLAQARILANQLEGLNRQRRQDTDQIFKAAQDQIVRQPELLRDAALVLAHESWEGGVIGIVANRLAELYHRPVILLACPPDAPARGSARSVPGVDITAALAQVDTGRPGLLLGYGGHTMAAGLSLPAERIPEFRRALGRVVASMLPEEAQQPALEIDAHLPLAAISLELVERLGRLAPFGPGNPAPLLATSRCSLKSRRSIGRDGEHLRLTVEDEAGSVQDVLWWRAEVAALPAGRFDLVYTLRSSEYAGNMQVQAELIALRPVAEEPQTFAQRGTVKVDDYRHLPLEQKLQALVALGETLVWNEGDPIPDVAGVRRDALRRAATLAIWTIPPGPQELAAALEAVNPARVVLFAVPPGSDTQAEVMQQLAGLVKSVMKSGRAVTLAQIAARMGQRESAVSAGLAWLEVAGKIRINEDDGVLWFAAGHDRPGDVQAAAARLNAILEETAAYRVHFCRADAQSLVQFYIS